MTRLGASAHGCYKMLPESLMTVNTTTSVKLDESTKARVHRLAQARRRSAHWLMREAIEQYVEREERKDAFRESALASWEEYRSGGRHVTEEEADAWLARLEAGEEAEPPQCHD